MTEDQYQKAQALSKVFFIPGTWDKRFSRTLQSYPFEKELTHNQAYWLEQLYHKYRRQIPKHKVNCKICRGEMEKAPRKKIAPEMEDLDKLQQWQNSVQETQQPSEQDKQPKLFE